MNADITSIVINWNLKKETTCCLASLEKSTITCRTILVDNGSIDGSPKELCAQFPDIDLIQLPTNIGFGPACNLAIQRALQDPVCEYIFLLNNDARIHPTTLETLQRSASEYPQAGIFGPIVYDQGIPARIWFAGAHRRYGVLAANTAHRGKIDRGQFSTSVVDYVFGAAMFIRRQVFENVGFFDERFFLYLEDLDFCLRAQSAGFSLVFIPKARVWHIGSASTSHNLALRRYHHIHSSILFLKKHALRLSLLPALIYWFLVLLRMVFYDFISGDLSLLASYSSALRHGVRETLVYSNESSD